MSVWLPVGVLDTGKWTCSQCCLWASGNVCVTAGWCVKDRKVDLPPMLPFSQWQCVCDCRLVCKGSKSGPAPNVAFQPVAMSVWLPVGVLRTEKWTCPQCCLSASGNVCVTTGWCVKDRKVDLPPMLSLSQWQCLCDYRLVCQVPENGRA